MRRRFERGEGKAGCIIGLIFLALALWIGIKFLPVRVAVASMQDYVEQTAMKANSVRPAEGQSRESMIKHLILKKGEDERLPVKAEDIEVRLTSEACIIDVKYTKVIDFGFYKYHWNVEHHADRTLF